MTTFIHAADLHLGAPLTGLARRSETACGIMAQAKNKSFATIVDRAIEDTADILLLSGDIFDKASTNLRTEFFAARTLSRFVDAGGRVFIIAGNHDAHTTYLSRLGELPGVTLFGSEAAEQFDLKELGVAITGQSFGARVEARDLAASYPAPLPGRFNIALLHSSCEGSEHHDVYAPCSVANLAASGYDYWALGHIHEAQIVQKNPWIVYAGCPQGRSSREVGEKGVFKGVVNDNRLSKLAFIETSAIRWERLVITLDNNAREAALDGLIADAALKCAQTASDKPVICRIKLCGATPLNAALRARSIVEWTQAAQDACDGLHPPGIFVEMLTIETTPIEKSISWDPAFLDCLYETAKDPELTADIETLLASVAKKAKPDIVFSSAQTLIQQALAIIEARVIDAGEDDAH